MKKRISILSIFVLLVCLVGCKNPMDPKKNVITVGEDKAREIVTTKVPNGKIIKYSYDSTDEPPNYEITVTDNSYIYKYEINAVDGSIIKENKEAIPDKDKKPQSSNIKISESKAKDIVIAKVPKGEIIEYSFDGNDAVPNYEITVVDASNKYKFKISAIDGSVIEESKTTK